MGRFLPSRLPGHLLRLHHTYDRIGNTLLRDVIAHSHLTVLEDVDVDNWNGGTYGHDVFLFLPLDEIVKIDPDAQEHISGALLTALKTISGSVENEYYRAVHIEMADEADELFQKAVPFSSRPVINPDDQAFWKPGLARLFMSHRDEHKRDAKHLGEALEDYGISCFVAHDTIQPMSEWRNEIMKGLETMEVMLVYLTDDFDQSVWTNQEVGYALGKGVPIISLKLGPKDPPGFVSHVQALRGDPEKPWKSAEGLFPLIGAALGRQERLQQVLVASFVDSPSWSDARDRFDRMSEAVTTLPPEQLAEIVAGFRKNDQLYSAIYLINNSQRLKRFLDRVTGKSFQISGREITER